MWHPNDRKFFYFIRKFFYFDLILILCILVCYYGFYISEFYADISNQHQMHNINHVWVHFCKFLVVVFGHRCPWVRISDTYISICINTYIKVVYLAIFAIFMPLNTDYGRPERKSYRNDFKHNLNCCTWRWLQMST